MSNCLSVQGQMKNWVDQWHYPLEKLADQLETSKKNLQRYLKCERKMPNQMVEKMFEIFGIHITVTEDDVLGNFEYAERKSGWSKHQVDGVSMYMKHFQTRFGETSVFIQGDEVFVLYNGWKNKMGFIEHELFRRQGLTGNEQRTTKECLFTIFKEQEYRPTSLSVQRHALAEFMFTEKEQMELDEFLTDLQFILRGVRESANGVSVTNNLAYWQRQLKSLRLQYERTQEEVAESLFISQHHYARYENGTSPLPLDVLEKLMKLYHRTLFLTNSEDPFYHFMLNIGPKKGFGWWHDTRNFYLVKTFETVHGEQLAVNILESGIVCNIDRKSGKYIETLRELDAVYKDCDTIELAKYIDDNIIFNENAIILKEEDKALLMELFEEWRQYGKYPTIELLETKIC